MNKRVISEDRVKELVNEVVERFIKEQQPVLPQKKVAAVSRPDNVAVAKKTPTQKSATVASSEVPMAKPKPKATVVKFDTNTEDSYTVKFSERGFSIGGTRLSFETLKNALSKGYNIVLDSGQGLELTPVRMQQILKYEDKY